MENILELEHITKSFPGVLALDNIHFALRKGEVHALVGENGAGKSTMMKVFTGVNKPDKGVIKFEGVEYNHFDIAQAKKLGISMIYQELHVIPFLSISENVFFGKEPRKGLFVDYKTMTRKTKEILCKLGISLDPRIQVKGLTVAFQQIVEICKAISDEAKVMIMDEPTAPLTNEEVELLFGLIERLKSEGVSIIYISHRLEEIFRMCDRVTVFRDGKFIATKDVKETCREELIRLMVGRDLSNQYPPTIDVRKDADTILRVEGIQNKKLRDVSISLLRGEILGIGGLVGSGRTELLRAIYGCDQSDGSIYKNSEKLDIHHPADAIKNGIVLVPEDRKGQGLLLKMSVKDNIVFPMLKKLRRFGLLDNKSMRVSSIDYITKLNIKTPSERQIVRLLSGGNQQKVVIAKWLLSKADVIMFDEPTRGIDVSAKYEIYCLMNALKEQGKSIIMVSSDMPELVGMSDRIVVMCEGRVTGILHDKLDFTQEKILHHASVCSEMLACN